MSSTRIPSPARSQGSRGTPRQRRSRASRSADSLALPTTSVKLSRIAQENKRNSFMFSPLPGRKSVLSDNTEINTPKRRSWWKRLDENSKEVMEFMEGEQEQAVNVEELVDAEILSQEKQNYTIDLPESSDGESIRSIVLPQRKLFTQKDQAQKVFKNVMDNRENLERLQKSKVNNDNTIYIAKKDLFNKGNRERSKPVFPAALLNITDKTVLQQSKRDKDVSKQGQIRNLFGNRLETKRKNMFAEFIVSDADDEISDTQPKIFGFRKTSQQQHRRPPPQYFREASPTSDITDVDLDDWKLLPSSTMVENQFGNLESNTPVKKARLSKILPASNETVKSNFDQVTTNNKSFKNSENKLTEDVSQNQKPSKNIVTSINAKTSQVSNENIVPETTQKACMTIDTPMVDHDSRKSKTNENLNNGTNISQNIFKNDEVDVQNNEEYVPMVGNQEQIDDIEMEKSISNDIENLADGKNEATEENHAKSVHIEISQNSSGNNDEDLQCDEDNDENLQEDENNDDNLQENENNDADLQEDENKDAYLQEDQNNDDVPHRDKDIEVEERNGEESDDIQIAQTISRQNEDDLPEIEEYEGNPEEFSDNKIRIQNSKNNEEIPDVESIEHSKNRNNLSVKENLRKNEVYSEDGLQKDDKYEDGHQVNSERIDKYDNREKNQELPQERQKNVIIDKEIIVELRKSSYVEGNKNVVDNQEQLKNVENNIKNNKTRNISTYSLNKSKDGNSSRNEEYKTVINNEGQHKVVEEKNNRTQANATDDPNKSRRQTKNRSHTNQDSIENKNSKARNHKEMSVRNQSMTDAAHNISGKNKEPAELEIESPEAVRNYIANNIELISPTDRGTNSRKTRSVNKLNDLRPSLAPLRESTGLSDGTVNSSVERSGWDSHRTTRKTLRQTFGKDFTPRKSLRALVMEKSAKRQTYGFDVTTKIPQACSTRLPENMHDVTDHEINEQEHRNKVVDNEKSPVKLQENDVKSEGQDDSQGSDKAEEINKEQAEYQNMQEDNVNGEEIRNSQEMEVSESDEESIQDSGEEELQHLEDQEAEVKVSNGDMSDSQNNQVGETDEELQDSHDVQEDMESEDSQNIEEGQSDEEKERSLEVEGDDGSDQEMRYSEDDEGQESEKEMRYSPEDDEGQENEEESRYSQDIEDRSRKHRMEIEINNSSCSESDEGRRYSSQITLESDEEKETKHVDSQKATKNVSRQRYFFSNSTREQPSNFTEESNTEDSIMKKRNIMEILQKVKQQNMEMSRQAEQVVRKSLKRPSKESIDDIFKVPFRSNAAPRRLKPVAAKPKPKSVKSTLLGVENLPPEVLEDLNYKPPKRYRPSNASWITNRLYKFLEKKLEPKYDYRARVQAEKLAEALYEFAKETRKRNVADSNSVDILKKQMARLGVVSTHFEFYQFFHDFMPREIRIKVVPDIVNKISMPRHGIFSDIIR